MMNFVLNTRNVVSKNERLCIENEELCFKNDAIKILQGADVFMFVSKTDSYEKPQIAQFRKFGASFYFASEVNRSNNMQIRFSGSAQAS